jgi:hypothetical protein
VIFQLGAFARELGDVGIGRIVLVLHDDVDCCARLTQFVIQVFGKLVAIAIKVASQQAPPKHDPQCCLIH